MLRILMVCAGLALLAQPIHADQDDLLQKSSQAMEQALKFKPGAVDFDQASASAKKEMASSNKAFSQMETNPPVMPTVPKLDLMSIPTPKIDLNRLAEQGRAIFGGSNREEVRYESQILVFVSSSMPIKTVQNYLMQTADIGAALIFRGLKNNSMKDMQVYLSEIIGDQATDNKPTILIDPTLFDRFNIQQVPVILATESQIQPCKESGCPTPVYHTVSGDVSLPWALGLISRQSGSVALKATLRPLIKDMEQL